MSKARVLLAPRYRAAGRTATRLGYFLQFAAESADIHVPRWQRHSGQHAQSVLSCGTERRRQVHKLLQSLTNVRSPGLLH